MVSPDAHNANLVIKYKVLLESVLRNALGMKVFNEELNFASFAKITSLSILQQVNALLVTAFLTITCVAQANSILIQISSNLDVFLLQIAQSIMELCLMEDVLFVLQTVQ